MANSMENLHTGLVLSTSCAVGPFIFHTKKTCLGTPDANISLTCDFDFFSSVFVFVFFQSDVSLNGFKKHKAHESAPPPLTTQELELEMVKQQEVRDLMSWNFVLNAIGHVLNQHGT